MARRSLKKRTHGRPLHTTYNEMMQRFADEYRAESGKELITTKELSYWAVTTGRWEPPPDLSLRKCREDFSRALREQYISNDRGQPVRAKHATRVRVGDEQLTFWGDIRTAPRDHIEGAMQQRREQIVGDCRQLDRDATFYNDQHPHEPPIQTEFDFTDDVLEGRFSGDLDEFQPDDESDSGD